VTQRVVRLNATAATKHPQMVYLQQARTNPGRHFSACLAWRTAFSALRTEFVLNPDLPATGSVASAGNSMSVHPGATWRRIDLQCHTPRDLGWQGSPALPGGTAEYEQARRDWAAEFVAAAMERSLSVVAVTDHHDIAMLPYIRAAASAADGDLLVLPGVEVTCKDSVQCLAIFEPDTDHEDLGRFLTKLSSIVPSHEHEGRTAQTADCGLNIAELFCRVREDAVLASKILLLPHFGNPSAYKSLNSNGFSARAVKQHAKVSRFRG
jgi:chromosome segregation protein